MKPRRLARVAVLQTLYELDSTTHDVEQAFAQRLADTKLPPGAHDFAHELVRGVVHHRHALDEIIRQIAPEWPLDQMALIDRNILRIGVFEMLLGNVTPMKVAINEAIELAKIFGSDSSARFVNGALGALAERLNEFQQQVNRLIQAS